MTREPKKLPKKEAIRTKYGQNTDKPEKTWWLDPLAPLWI